ncbi:hypothetical protein [Tabrizicola sp.]|uniref:hypothetical protein n=1 Tax=Tabrizicola sp. TaxID=2005166 RepID=UPI003D27AAC7
MDLDLGHFGAIILFEFAGIAAGSHGKSRDDQKKNPKKRHLPKPPRFACLFWPHSGFGRIWPAGFRSSQDVYQPSG